MAAEAYVQLLGQPGVRVGGKLIDFLPNKRFQLLAYLAYQGDWVSRDKLAFLFWPDETDHIARHNLRQLLKHVREFPWLTRLETNNYQLHWPIATDLQAFREALSQRHWGEAFSLYKGELLENFRPRGMNEFNSWLESERRSLSSVWCETGLKLAVQLGDSGRYAQTSEVLKRLHHVDPLDEEVVQRYLKSLSLSGQRSEALEVYNTFKRNLKSEIDDEPGQVTLQLIEHIRWGTPLSGEADQGAAKPQVGFKKSTSLKPHHNLPSPPTSFVGREREKRRLTELLHDTTHRLLTVIGEGGIGKTRLAVEVACGQVEVFEDGVYFVPLAPLSSPDFIISAIASALSFTLYGTTAPKEQIREYLRDKNLLLVLDNFEHLLDASPLVSELLAAAPRLKMLVTSRAPLHLYGEREYSLPPLGLPKNGELERGWTDYEAIRLFVERAQNVKDDLIITHENAGTIAQICERLDGLPLAIELAAAQTKLLSPRELLRRLGDGFALLTGGAQDLPERHQTLRRTIDWGYDLLSEDEQALFRLLSVFAGGFTLEAANAVSSSVGSLPREVDKGVAALFDKSLLRVREEAETGPRFIMLSTIREYALETLVQNGEKESIHNAHAHYFMRFAEVAEQKLRGAEQLNWLKNLKREHNNIRAALSWSEESGHAQVSLRLSGSLLWFWYYAGHAEEGRQHLTRALTQPDAGVRNAARAKALQAAGRLAKLRGDTAAARSFLKESLAISREVGDSSGTARTLNYLALLAIEIEKYKTARVCYKKSLTIFRELDDLWGVAWTLNNFGELSRRLGNDSQARMMVEEALAIRRQLGEQTGVAQSVMYLGLIAQDQGDHASARSHFSESLAIYRKFDNSMGVAWILVNLGKAARDEGDYNSAQLKLEESLDIFKELGDQRSVAVVLKDLSDVCERRDNWSSAISFAEESLKFWTISRHKRYMADCLDIISGAQRRLNEAKLDRQT